MAICDFPEEIATTTSSEQFIFLLGCLAFILFSLSFYVPCGYFKSCQGKMNIGLK